MGLNDFKKDDKKTSSVTNASGPDEGGVEDFLEEDDETIEVEGGFELDLDEQDTYETEVVKVFGGPGTGKTTTLVGNTEIEDYSGILEHMFREYEADELLLIAYTRAAADEAKERLAKLTDKNKSTLEDRITTIHSLAMSKNNLAAKDIVEIRYANDKYNFCQQVGMEFDTQGGDDDPSEMMAEPDDEGHLFFKMLGWLKSSLKPATEWADCPLADNWDRDGEEFVKFAEAWSGYKNDKNIWEFDDAILQCCRDEVEVNADYLFVDEVQDLYPLQQEFIDNQFGNVKRLFLGGDDDQCLPPWETVSVKADDGEVIEKEISKIETGERVASMLGGGSAVFKEVTDKVERVQQTHKFKTFTTESGKQVTVTNNHKMFTRIPKAEYETISDCHYVYLMRDDDNRWRVGETDNLRQRLNVERNARCIVPLETCENRDEALLKEAQYSLNYSIPTTSFTQRQGEVLAEESVKDRLYSNINMNLSTLQETLDVDIHNPPLFKKATTRGRTGSLNINLEMCSDTRNAYIGHRLEIHTSNEEYVEVLKDVDMLNSSERRGGNWRFRKMSSDLDQLGSLAEAIQSEIGGDVLTQMKPTSTRDKSHVVPAKNIVEGMFVPVLNEEDNAIFEEVVSVTEDSEVTSVYDITVDGTHNFASNKIFTHNTIYEWAGAKPEYFLEMEGKINNEMPELWEDKTGYWQDEGVYILDQSWRMPNNILELAKMCIHQVDERQEKQIKHHHEGGEFVPLRNPEPKKVMSYINHDDTMMLFRAKYQIGNFADQLIDAGIPYKDYRFKNSSYGTWNKDSLQFRDGMRAIIKKEQAMTGNQASTIIEEMPSTSLHKPKQREVDSRTFSKQKDVPTNEVVDKVVYQWPEDMQTLRKWLLEFEELNWYQERAVRNNLTSEHIDKYPEGLNLSTIHGSKGREADTIILSLDTAKPVVENMPKDGLTDAERRLYYVGLTRTENQLVVVEDMDEDSPTMRIDTILGKEWRDQYEWQNFS